MNTIVFIFFFNNCILFHFCYYNICLVTSCIRDGLFIYEGIICHCEIPNIVVGLLLIASTETIDTLEGLFSIFIG